MALTVDILTIFPEMFSNVINESILGRAREAGLVEVRLTNLRDFTHDRHRSVDDRPYGGGPGMVFKPEPVFEAIENVTANPRAPEAKSRKLILTPQGQRIEQRDFRELAGAEWIVLVCGHYEGFDERILQGLPFEQVSIGDYILSGGELPAMVILDGVVRLLPGAVGHPESTCHESFETDLLDYPHYTRPPVYRGMKVPEVLLSGNHAEIAEWRKQQAILRTAEKRKDLLSGARSNRLYRETDAAAMKASPGSLE